ncbi:MAG: extracellular solute-binding protein, partial [Chloroflexi bacterium]|nr:extracellular solute-binding protein [Chloroflexota bacterium]
MTRKLLVLCLIVVLAISVMPAVGQDGADESLFPIQFPEEIAEGREVTISVAAAIGDDQVEVREQWDAQIARFEEQYPNVTVETVIYAFSPETFAALVAGEQLPTLFEVPFTEPQKLIQQGVPADLSPLFEKFGISGLYNDAVMDVVSDEAGNVYGLPGFAYALGLAYNIPALNDAGYDAPPATYEELAEMAAGLTDREAFFSGFAMNMQGGGGGWHFTNIAYGFGADIIRDNGDGTYTATFGEGPAVEAMQYIYDLRWEYDALPLDLATNPTLALLEDTGAMAIQGGDSLGWLRLNAAGWAEGEYADTFDLGNFGFAAMPAGPDGNRYALTGGTARMINGNASADEQEAAFIYQMWKEFSDGEIVPTREIFHNTQAGQGAPILPILAGEYQEAMDAIDASYITMPVENYEPFVSAVQNGESV